MRTRISKSDLEEIQNKNEFSEGGILPTKQNILEADIITLIDGEITEQKFSINKDYQPDEDNATNLRRAGLVIISQLKNEFENVDFTTKFAEDLKTFKNDFPTANKTTFIEDETTRLNKIKEYIQQTLPDNYSDFPIYQTVNSYLVFIQEPDQNQEPKKNEHKSFVEYLQTVDKNKLMILLHELLDNANTKDFARFMIALKELKYLHIPSPRNHLYKAMRDRFKNIGSDAAMNSYFSDNERDKTKISLHEIEETKQLIEKRLNY